MEYRRLRLAEELLQEMDTYYKTNNLGAKLLSPINESYIDLLRIRPAIVFGLIDPAKTDITSEEEINKELKRIKKEEPEVLLRFDLTVRGAVFLYLNEILSYHEVRRLLNLDWQPGQEQTGIHLYKRTEQHENGEYDSLGAYDIILSLLSVLFGKITYEQSNKKNYKYERLTVDKFYSDLPTYYYSYRASLSYKGFEALKDATQWFVNENYSKLAGYSVMDPITRNKRAYSVNDILGMMRINNKYSQFILEENGITDVPTEYSALPIYNISLNVKRVTRVNKENNSTVESIGFGNVLFDYYKSVTETTMYTEDDIDYTEILWDIIKDYSLYIDTVLKIKDSQTAKGFPNQNLVSEPIKYLEKTKFILEELQNFLLH